MDSVPGIFVLNAAGQGAIINQDGTVNSAKNGAAIGSVVSIYATGQGQTNPAGDEWGDRHGCFAAAAAIAGHGSDRRIARHGVVRWSRAGSARGVHAGQRDRALGHSAGTSVSIDVSVGTAASQSGVTIAIASLRSEACRELITP